MLEPLVVVGAGGFGREVLDVIDAINEVAPTWEIIGAIDDGPSPENLARLTRRRVTHLGGVKDWLPKSEGCKFVVGIGDPSIRRRVAETFHDAGSEAATIVHPTATFGFDVRIGAGTVICAGARLTTNIHLGSHVHVNPNVTIGHDTRIEDYVSLNPQAAISGDCTIGAGTLVGVAATVLNQVTIGHSVIVGGQACVTRDVSDAVTVKGVPAR